MVVTLGASRKCASSARRREIFMSSVLGTRRQIGFQDSCAWLFLDKLAEKAMEELGEETRLIPPRMLQKFLGMGVFVQLDEWYGGVEAGWPAVVVRKTVLLASVDALSRKLLLQKSMHSVQHVRKYYVKQCILDQKRRHQHLGNQTFGGLS